jgi:cyclopropane-fatty-acyl-phospholipid synthase
MNTPTTYLLKSLGRLWHGPAIAVELPDREQTIKLGWGKAKTTVVMNSSVRPWELVKTPSLTFGEGYMKGDITIRGDLMDVLLGYQRNTALLKKAHRLLIASHPASGRAAVDQAIANARHHYDISNDFYKLWLDPSLTYSCAYFPNGDETLAEAQFKKRELICQKLVLEKPGLTLLDIGCGWGGLLFHAAERYGIIATGLTPAQEQARYIEEEAVRRGLQDRVKVIVGDWREHKDRQYDRLVSVGMFEHVGEPQYEEFFAAWHSLLKPAGISLLHTIGNKPPSETDPWLDKYIFPGGRLPTAREIKTHAAAASLTIPKTKVDSLPAWHNLKPHYAKTLAHWARNYAAAREQVLAMFDEEFYRMWWLYLKGSEAGFRTGSLQLYQVVLSAQRRTGRHAIILDK